MFQARAPPPHPPLPPSLWISTDFQWIWVDFLHVDSHLYLYYLQGISRRQVLVVVQDSAHTPSVLFGLFSYSFDPGPFLYEHLHLLMIIPIKPDAAVINEPRAMLSAPIFIFYGEFYEKYDLP